MRGFGRFYKKHRNKFNQAHKNCNNNRIRIALAGNPNSGKTSIFNVITGQNQHIGNYPGVTVEKKSGIIKYENYEVEIIDLPGTYSLSAYSMEEIVSRDFVLEEKPDVIIDVMDSTNLERHMYLLLQFQELGVPIVGALNMSDEAEQNGIRIDDIQLGNILGIPLVKTIGSKGIGVIELMQTAIKVAMGKLRSNERHINYGPELEEAHNKIIDQLLMDKVFSSTYSVHWTAIKLLENDKDAVKKIRENHKFFNTVLEISEKTRMGIEKHFGEDSEIVVSEQRYAYIHGALKETLSQKNKENQIDITEKIDRIVLHRFLGVPIFLLVMFLIYQITFSLGNPVSALFDKSFYFLKVFLEKHIADGILLDFFTGGIIDGVGGVLMFLPMVVFLFMGLSFLEDTGYMARAAFVMDKFFHIFGLHGRSFIPFMVSTGCAVPGVMSARVLANPKDRIVTILVAPFMMCSAKAPVIAMLAAAFYPKHAGLVFWLMWMFGWLSAFIVALFYRKTIFAGKQTPFVMELPPYRMPTIRGIIQHMMDKSLSYIKKAGTLILAASIMIWFLLSFPKTDYSNYQHNQNNEHAIRQNQIENSFGGKLGKTIEPVLKPAGFDWKLGVSLFAGIAAKEVILSTMGILYGVEDNTEEGSLVKDKIKNDPNYNPLTGFTLMVFIMLYIPCIATLAVVRKELGSWKWAAFQAGYTLFIAYFLAVIIYQSGLLLGFGG